MTVIVSLSRGFEALISDCDAEMILAKRWFALTPSLSSRGKTVYAFRTESNKTVRMHRLILNAPDGTLIDHINHNGLDNRRENLRFATASQNVTWSTRKPPESGFRGVRRRYNGWKAFANLNGRVVCSAWCETREEAAREYDRIATELFGEFARLNFPPSGENA